MGFVKIINTVVLIIFFTLIINWIVNPVFRIQGISGVLWESIFPGHDTVYANKYSDEGFLEIELGMTEQEVKKILGEPLTIWQPNDSIVCYAYSESLNSTHYRARNIEIKQGVVDKILGEYYID